MTEHAAPHVITIGYAKRALQAGSRERARMSKYASVLGSLHVVVFTGAAEGFPAIQQEGSLFLYATNSRHALGKLLDACRIVRTIMSKEPTRSWLISSQDPFETSLVARAAAFGRRATHQVQLHGDHFSPRARSTSLLTTLRLAFGRLVVRHTGCVRVVSERIKRSLLELGVPETRIFVFPIQADLEQFLAVGQARTYTARSPLSFLYVGRLAPEKNLPLLISAFSDALSDEGAPATLTLLGSGPEEPALRALVAAFGREDVIDFQGWTEHVPAVMAEHDVLCLSSDHEGWAMVLLEAAAAGMAIITTDVGCANEAIKNGEHGFVVSVGDREAYAAAVRQYRADPSRVVAHGRRAHRAATALSLSEQAYLARMRELYSHCFSNEHPGILPSNGTS